MLQEKQYEKLVREITKLCKVNEIDEQLIDFQHETDYMLSYEENYNILKEMYNLKDNNDMKEYAQGQKEKIIYEKWNDIKSDGLSLFQKYTPFFVACVGERNSGKTAFGHVLVDRLRKIKKMPIYVYKYPNEVLIHRLGYKNLKDLRSLEHLRDMILWLDECQISLKKLEKRNNDILMEILSICRHRNIILVVTTSDTRWINKGLESYVDVWVCKDIDFEMVKNGARIKHIIRENAVLDPQAFRLKQDEYLMYYRKDEQYQGKFKFNLPKYWNNSYSKPYESCD